MYTFSQMFLQDIHQNQMQQFSLNHEDHHPKNVKSQKHISKVGSSLLMKSISM